MFSTLELEHLLKQEITGLTYLISVFKKVDYLQNQRYHVLLKNRLNSLKILLNRIEADENTPVERKATLLEDIAVSLSDIIFMEDLSEQFELTWYEINALRLQIIAKLMQFWGKRGIIRMRGLGLALENLLLGLKIPNIAPLLKVAPDHTIDLDRLFLALSVLNAKFQIHAGAILALHEIPWKDFERWTREAFNAADELMEILENHWNLKHFYQWGKEKDPDLPFTIITNYLAVPLNIIAFLLSVHQMVGGKWPPSLLSGSFMKEGSTEELLATVGSLIRFVEQKIEEITTSHVFQGDDKPLKDPLMSFYIHHFWRYRLIHEGLALTHFMECTTAKEQFLPRLERLVGKIIELLQARSFLMEDPEYLKTTSGEQLVEALSWFIPIIAYHDWINVQLTNLKQFERVLGTYLQREGFERFPQLGLLFHQVMIAVASKTHNSAVMLRSSKKLLEILNHLDFYPRDRLACALLGHLILRILKIENNDEFIEHINQEILTAYKNGISSSFLSIAMCHAEHLKKAVLDSMSTPHEPCRKFKKHLFDPKSFFLPDLEFLKSRSELASVCYEPLNLEVDRIS